MSHHHSDHPHDAHHPPRKPSFHRDWRFWVAVLLMLGAMAAYVATMDEAIRPGGKAGQPVPAAE
jgi:hypothetical protein